MMHDTLQDLRKWFENYVAAFTHEEGLAVPMQILKRDHSRRVAGECQGIASDSSWSAGDVVLAEAVGLLHDVGRFTQYREFHTFSDLRSVNHAERGCEVLARECTPLSGIDPADKQRLLDGVRHHNKTKIPENITPASIPYVQIVRDADKIDIFQVVNNAQRDGSISNFPDIILGIDVNGGLNPDLLQSVQNLRCGSYRDVRSLADLNLLQIAWVYDLNYQSTFRRVAERRILENIRGLLPAHPAIDSIYRHATSHVAARVDHSESGT